MNLTGARLALVAVCALSLPAINAYLIMDILKVVQLATNSFYHTWDLVEAKTQPEPGTPYYQEKVLPEEYNMKDSPVFFAKRDEFTLLARINEVNRKIANIEDRLRGHEQIVMTKLELIPHAVMTEMKVNQVLDIVKNVEALHERFVGYTKTGFKGMAGDGKPGLERLTINSFAKFVTDHQPTTPLSIMDKFHAILVPHLDSDRLLGSESFFYTFRDYILVKKMLLPDMKPVLLCAMALFSITSAQDAGAREVTHIDQVRNKVMKRIDELSSETAAWSVLAKKKPGFDADLVAEFRKICDIIDSVHIPELPNLITDRIMTYGLFREEEDNVRSTYAMFRKLQLRPDPVIFGDLWRQLANSVLKDGTNNRRKMVSTLGVLQELIDDGVEGHKNIFQTALENAEQFSCDVKQSPQQLLFNMYNTFQLTQLKAYTMVHFSWELLRLYDQGNFTLEAELLKTSYLQRMAQQAIAIKAAMKDCRNDYWECDPKEHVEGETYTKITKFLQGYIVNEVDLNTENTCRENCAFYKYTKQNGCFKDQFCSQQPPCRGNIVGCKFVDSDMWICQSGHFADRRYDWIEYENGRALGQRKACSRAVKKVDSWWRYLFWHCSYCFCYCDDPNDAKTERYFSLRPSTVDTANNKVVTGLRFIKLDKIIHLQVQQGELLPHGEINETTVEWVPVKQFGIKDEGVLVGRDYHMLTWEARAIDLDDIKLPAGQVMTGVKFRRIGGHLNFEVQGNEFNYLTGKLTHNGSKSEWRGNENTDGNLAQPRTPHLLKNPDAPYKSSGLNQVDSKPDTFVEFTSSDADLDVGQTAVPFIDIQPVTPKLPVALVGAGIFHKGRSYSGGYIAIKVFTYNQANHVQEVFPDLNEADF